LINLERPLFTQVEEYHSLNAPDVCLISLGMRGKGNHLQA